MDEDDVSDALKGKTLAVYYFLLSSDKPIAARDLQRRMHISSPSLALYHLKKLEDLGLVEQKPDEGFVTTKFVKVGVLNFFVGKGRLLLPRYAFYSVFATSFLVATLVLFGLDFTPTFVLLLVLLMFVVIVFWFETLSVWRSRPVD